MSHPNGQNDPNQNSRNDFEAALHQAMQRVDAPPTLLKFLTAAAEAQADRHLPRRERRHQWVWVLPKRQAFGWLSGALAAALVATVFTAQQLHHRHQQQLADRQFLTAVRVTDHALDQTRAQLLRAGINLPE